MDEILKILRELDWSPLYISLKTGVVATIISFFLGIFAARKVVKAGPRVKAIADGILTLPMVLPPTVAGFFLLLLFHSGVGRTDFLTCGTKYSSFGTIPFLSWWLIWCIIDSTL